MESNWDFYLPSCLAALYNASELAELEDTSHKIANTFFTGHHVSFGWVVTHITMHLDFLTRNEYSGLEILLSHLDDEMYRRGYAKPY